MNIIFGNYGDNTIALIQWAAEAGLEQVTVAHVDTSWAAAAWASRVEAGQALARRCDFEVVEIKAQQTFADLVRDRKTFPNQKFQWCAGFLKGLSFLAWADQVDPGCEAVVLLGSRRADSRARHDLPEHIEESEHFGERTVWYPLFKHDDEQRRQLIERAGFQPLGHRSLECDPCIHSAIADLRRMDEVTVQRTAELEQEIGSPMFTLDTVGGASGIQAAVEWAREQKTPTATNSLESFDMGCGSPFGCGE